MELKLPPSIVDRTDINRILRDLDEREAQFIAAAAKSQVLTTQSSNQKLSDLAGLNSIDLADRDACQKLKAVLEQMAAKLPEIHLSLANEAPQEIIESLTTWFRTNIHPGILVKIGLQPSLAAGCVVRTPNKIFDMSLRAQIRQQQTYLEELIRGAVRGK